MGLKRAVSKATCIAGVLLLHDTAAPYNDTGIYAIPSPPVNEMNRGLCAIPSPLWLELMISFELG